MLIGVPFACLVRLFHSRQTLRLHIHSFVLQLSNSRVVSRINALSSFPFAITLTDNSLQCPLPSVFLSTLDFFSLLVRGFSRPAVSPCSRTIEQHRLQTQTRTLLRSAAVPLHTQSMHFTGKSRDYKKPASHS